MTHVLAGVVTVLGLIGLASFAAPRVRIPPPILLAVTGIVWSLLPFIPHLEIEPTIVVSVFLPPLLYADAWRASWYDFRRWMRPILQLAVGLVAFTILGIGVVTKWLLPELPWAACFALGAILSPTDTVAIHDVLSRLRVPRRLTAVLSGESLINDATGLLGVQLAMVVLFTGLFEAGAIASQFALIAGGGLAAGVAIGALAAVLNARLRGTTLLFVFSLFCPYLAFLAAEAIGASGILAVVVAGFVASWRIDLLPFESRTDLVSAWNILTFVLNALMFLFIGIEIPRRLGEDLSSSAGLLATSVAIAGVVILIRMVWVWPMAYLPLWLFPKMREREGGYPPPQAVMIASWCGVRGAVSLAAALALPLTLPDGSPFPGRTQIIAATLVTILATLVGQGMTLAPLVRWLGLRGDADAEHETRKAREAMLAAGIARLDQFCSEESCPVAVYRYRELMSDELAELRTLDDDEREQASKRIAVSKEVRRAVLEAESAELLRLRDASEINDRTHQVLQLQLDRDHGDLRSA